MTAGQAICEATDLAMAADPRVILMGEGVADPKAIFGTTAQLADKYGRQRVIELPLSENGSTGIAIGAAMNGLRPIIVHQRAEFCLLAMEQLVNNAAKIHYVSNGAHSAPLVVRLIVGRGWGQGPAHSQSLEALFAHIPGLKVVMPSSAPDAKGMLLAAIADDSPVIFIEHRWVHYVKGHVPPGLQLAPLDGPARLREGNAVTVVSNSYLTLETLRAADTLHEHGIAIDLFDLRVIRPLSLDPILASVRRTGRLVTVDTGFVTYGIGAEIVSRAMEQCCLSMKAAPRRIGLPEHPTPSSRSLAAGYYPRSPDIGATVAEVADTPPARVSAIRAQLTADRESVPLDVPHHSFQGPF
ncbi:MAG TPA: transketolase C-terminal domain-containing protein [Xanthobacteraceae bacterium]|nr:transketolase C-terminal domain-containing protein [Xanthobacteraceae bacterium]